MAKTSFKGASFWWWGGGPSVVWLFEFLKNRRFGFFKYFRIKRTAQFSFSEKIPESKKHRLVPFLFKKPSKNWRSFGRFFNFWKIWGPWLYFKTFRLFEISRVDKWVSIYMCIYTRIDNRWVSFPPPKNCPRLGFFFLLGGGVGKGDLALQT